MKIGVRGGHHYSCPGAVGLISELEEDRKVVESLICYLKKAGHTVVDCTPSREMRLNSNQDLSYGVNVANRSGVELFVSIHFNNCYNSYNGAIGSEVCVYNTNNRAQRVVDALANLGFKNRGQKIRRGLYELRAASAPAMIVETCFVEATEDVRLYKEVGHDGIAKAIAEAICGTKIEGNGDVCVPNSPSNNGLDRALHYNGNTSRAKEIQEHLIAKGYNCGSYGADGIFGASTYEALKKFQADNGLDADGLCGNSTWEKLNYERPQGNDWVRRLQDECNRQGFSHQDVDGFPGKNTVNGCPLVKRGSRGNVTRLLQEKLNTLGYSTNGIDGIYGQGTVNAVSKFQRDNGLSADGVCGRNTWEKVIYA